MKKMVKTMPANGDVLLNNCGLLPKKGLTKVEEKKTIAIMIGSRYWF